MNLRELAREALSECDGDRDKAIARLTNMILRVPALARAVAESAASAEIRYLALKDCSKTFKTSDDHVSPESLSRVGGRIAQSLLDYRLSTSKRLANATLNDLRDEISIHYRNMVGNRIKFRWLSAVAEQLPDERKKVSDVLSESDLIQLREKALRLEKTRGETK